MENAKKNQLTFQNIIKSFGKNKVLNGISANIAEGRVTSLIGPNGAGKSTLLSIMSRLIKQDGGTVSFSDRELTSIPTSELAQKLSILKQANHFELRLTVQDLVSFGRFPYSKGKLTSTDRLRVKEALAFSDLLSLKDAYIDELSGGQRQRAFLAMIIAQDTDFILLDEPLNNLDMKHAVQVMKTLRRLADELGKTIVLVIHEINFAAQYSDRIMALKDGNILFHHATDEVINAEILKEVFGIEFDIVERNGKKICNYFNI